MRVTVVQCDGCGFRVRFAPDAEVEIDAKLREMNWVAGTNDPRSDLCPACKARIAKAIPSSAGTPGRTSPGSSPAAAPKP